MTMPTSTSTMPIAMSTAMHLLLLEDDIDLGQAVAEHLESHGHEVSWMKLCAQADAVMRQPDIAMALIDLRLPDGDGLDLIQQWRARGDQRPMMVLTARDQISDRVKGLQAGADDYLVKPFDLNEMAARVEALARRTRPQAPHPLQAGQVQLDFDHKVAKVGGQMLNLTAMEWTLLSCLAAQPGHTLSRQQIRQALFNPGRHEAESNSLEVIISRLRRKLDDDSRAPEIIRTVYGAGYIFAQRQFGVVAIEFPIAEIGIARMHINDHTVETVVITAIAFLDLEFMAAHPMPALRALGTDSKIQQTTITRRIQTRMPFLFAPLDIKLEVEIFKLIHTGQPAPFSSRYPQQAINHGKNMIRVIVQALRLLLGDQIVFIGFRLVAYIGFPATQVFAIKQGFPLPRARRKHLGTGDKTK